MSYDITGSSTPSDDPAERQRTEQPSNPLASSARLSDVTLARIIAQAVRATPGVVDLSAGLTAPVATYGAGQRVTGVIIHHPDQAPDSYVIEIHVILSEALCAPATSDSAVRVSDESVADNPERPRPIPEIAERIRGEARRAAQTRMDLSASAIDVFIDDLR